MWYCLYKYLQKSGFKVRYTGIDISPEAIKVAKNLQLKKLNCNFILTNIPMKLKKKFDHILINLTFNNTKNNWNWMRITNTLFG